MEPKEDLALRILLCCRNELYQCYPSLDGAFATLRPCPGEDTRSFGSRGTSLLFDPDYVLRLYAADPARLRRGYLHTLLHNLYLHPFLGEDRDPRLWNLACDLAVEQILEREQNPRLALPPSPVRQACFLALGDRPLSAQEIYGRLQAGAFSQPLEAMEAAVLQDDHSLWSILNREARKTWEHVLSYTSQNHRGQTRRRGTRAGDREEQVQVRNPGTYDYRTWLQQFSVPREELELDLDSFDYIYYHLGLERYGNLPLLEPLEYREGHKLEELVIAIDTSGSCTREIVTDFLRETYSILSRKENFFQKMTVYLIQCDCMVQSVAVIHSREEWQNYSRTVTIQGRGGTDFTPVFSYVDRIREQGKLQHLKALLYFTDGDGYYPREKTDYETAFVFLHPSEHRKMVPHWAKVLLVNDR